MTDKVVSESEMVYAVNHYQSAAEWLVRRISHDLRAAFSEEINRIPGIDPIPIEEKVEVQDEPKRKPAVLDREYLFYPQELVKLLKLDGIAVHKVRYEIVSNLWHITTTEDLLWRYRRLSSPPSISPP
jgi:hypothetical protein